MLNLLTQSHRLGNVALANHMIARRSHAIKILQLVTQGDHCLRATVENLQHGRGNIVPFINDDMTVLGI